VPHDYGPDKGKDPRWRWGLTERQVVGLVVRLAGMGVGG